MKRIKLFEAFNNTDKIEEVNVILFRWVIYLFIKENNLKVRMFNLKRIPDSQQYAFYLKKFRPDHEDYLYFTYYYYSPENSQLNIHCFSNLYQYFNMKGIKRCEASVRKAAMYVIKKMFEDEKNKAI